MITIGIPKELKPYEKRISIIPDDIIKLKKDNTIIYIQEGAGINSGYSDNSYIEQGCIICKTIEELYEKARIIIKVKEPQEYEYLNLIKDHHIIFAFFHFGGNKKLQDAMKEKKTKCIEYEIIKDENNNYPILAPMSKIAGINGMIIGNNYHKNFCQNNGIITIIGVGNVGKASFKQAINYGYKEINLIDKDFEKIKVFKETEKNSDSDVIINIYEMNSSNLMKLILESDIIISSIYITGEKAEKLISNEMMDLMKSNSIIIDIAIDQGGTTEQSSPTTIENPYIKYKNTCIYCVPNIPSTVPREASIELSNAISNYYSYIYKDQIEYF